MKKLILILLVINFGFAQEFKKNIERNIDYNGQSINLDVSFASDIKVQTWDKNEVYLKATIAMEKEEHLGLYDLDIDSGSNSIYIEENTKTYFETLKKERKSRYGKKSYWSNSEYEFTYELYVPKNVEFEVKSINGSLSSDEIVGDFRAELINGDIDIKKYSGRLHLSTINGAIDLIVANNQFVAETINGDIYADDNVKFKAHDRHVGHHIESLAQNTSTKLKLNTINGNMYLR